MPWNRIKSGARKSDVSERVFRRWLKEGLRHSRVHGTVFISDEALDEWFKAHEVLDDAPATTAADIVAGLK